MMKTNKTRVAVSSFIRRQNLITIIMHPRPSFKVFHAVGSQVQNWFQEDQAYCAAVDVEG